MLDSGKTVHRIACAAGHPATKAKVVEVLAGMGIASVLMENGRTVRRLRSRRRFRLLGHVDRLDNSPVEMFRFSVSPERSEAVVHRLATELQLYLPGRGTIYVQEAKSFVGFPRPGAGLPGDSAVRAPGLLRDLSLITCIMSMSGAGEELARLALELGTGVPMVTLGTGTGMRDRLGLLRITVPAEKELVHLLVPAHDAYGVVRMLIEKGRLNRPGRGFVYAKPVLCGFLDTSLQIGPQEHLASMAQVIAAIDELWKNTVWRRRFPELDRDALFQMRYNCDEIDLVCAEDRSFGYVEAAMQAGAAGATTARLRRLDAEAAGGAMRERCTIVVHRSATEAVLAALMRTHEGGGDPLEFLEVQPVPFSFSHQARIYPQEQA